MTPAVLSAESKQGRTKADPKGRLVRTKASDKSELIQKPLFGTHLAVEFPVHNGRVVKGYAGLFLLDGRKAA
jgi:hypothetical protein